MLSPFDHSDFPAVQHLVVLRAAEGDAEIEASGTQPPGGAAFAPLMLELMSHAQRVAVVEEAPSVMVELHRGGQAVVLVEYDRTPVITELIAAVARYYPRVSLWQAHRGEDGRPVLSRIVSTASVSAASQPHQLLDDLHAEAASAPHHETNPTPALVTDEELAMLMSPFDAEDET